MTLQSLVDDMVANSKTIRFKSNGFGGTSHLNSTLYYKWLAYYVSNYKPKNILELGRRYGNSTFAISEYMPSDATLTSYDVVECGNVVNKPNVHILTYDGDTSVFNFSDYDLIFTDINGGGDPEYKIYEQMLEDGYKGVSIWDDVASKHCSPPKFWDKVTSEKVKLVTPDHTSGFGFIKV